jgi:hypothetical protein
MLGMAGDPELLSKFANEGLQRDFIRFHLAAGKLPEPRMVLALRPSMHQPATVRAVQCACYHGHPPGGHVGFLSIPSRHLNLFLTRRRDFVRVRTQEAGVNR